MSNLRFNLVVAACNNNGIGINGKLPWNLRKDMDFFKKITSETKNAEKQNAVIMGRKTWFGIPEKFRPLRNRVNIVLSRELKEVPAGVYVCPSLQEAVNLVREGRVGDIDIENVHVIGGSFNITGVQVKTKVPEGVYVCRSLQEAVNLVREGRVGDIDIENVHVIGGSSVYEECMTGPHDCRVYLTRIFADFECDTFMPALDENTFRKVDNPADIPSQEEQEEKGIKFKFEVYDKVGHLNLSAPVNSQFKVENMESESEINQSNVGTQQGASSGQSEVTTNPSEDSEDQSEKKTCKVTLTDQSKVQLGNTSSVDQSAMATQQGQGHQPIKLNLMAAMMMSNRGIGFQERLPWPSLRHDYEYYTGKISTFDGEYKDGRIIVHISGRISWEGSDNHERYLDKVRRIIVSRTFNLREHPHPGILTVVPSFQAAVDYCNSPGVRENIDSVWVLGGTRIYEEAIHHPQCDQLYLTHVYSTFPADVFFPKFEPWFEEVRLGSGDEQELIEDNGVKYEFKVYRKKTESE